MAYLKPSEKESLRHNLDDMLDNDILRLSDAAKIFDIFAHACSERTEEPELEEDAVYTIWCPQEAVKTIGEVLVRHNTGWSVSPQSDGLRIINVYRQAGVQHRIRDIMSDLNESCLKAGFTVHLMTPETDESEPGTAFIFTKLQ